MWTRRSWLYFGNSFFLFFFLIKKRRSWKCWAWSIHIGVGFKKHDIMPSAIHRSAGCCCETTLASFTVQTVSSGGMAAHEPSSVADGKLWKWVLVAVNCEAQNYVMFKSCAGVSVYYPELWVRRHILTELIFQSTADEDLWLKIRLRI